MTSAFNDKEIKYLKNYFDFKSISSYSNFENNIEFKQSIKEKPYFKNNENKKNEELDFTKVTEFDWGNDIITYSIPYQGESTKYFVSANNENLLKSFSLENLVDRNGNGNIFISTVDNNIKMTFSSGHLVSYEAINKQNSFQDCFQNAENTMCDDYVGTIAWYTNPQIAIMVATICAIDPDAF